MLACARTSGVVKFTQEDYQGQIPPETCVVSLQWFFDLFWYKALKNPPTF